MAEFKPTPKFISMARQALMARHISGGSSAPPEALHIVSMVASKSTGKIDFTEAEFLSAIINIRRAR